MFKSNTIGELKTVHHKPTINSNAKAAPRTLFSRQKQYNGTYEDCCTFPCDAKDAEVKKKTISIERTHTSQSLHLSTLFAKYPRLGVTATVTFVNDGNNNVAFAQHHITTASHKGNSH